MTETLYKVALHSHGDMFVSSTVRTGAALQYQLRQTTMSETPIFVFRDKERALKYMRSCAMLSPRSCRDKDQYALLEGTSSQESFSLRALRSELLAPTSILTPNMVKKFWQHDYTGPRMLPADDSYYGVYDFTPYKVLQTVPY